MNSDIMVDTNVLIYATETPAGRENPANFALRQSSRELLARLKIIRVCALTVMEYEVSTSSELPRAVRDKLHVEAVTSEVASVAAALFKAKNGVSDVCKRCLNEAGASPCVKCNRMVSRVHKQNDSVIVAAALVAPDVRVLYSPDGGMRDFARHLSGARFKGHALTINPLPAPVAVAPAKLVPAQIELFAVAKAAKGSGK